MNSNRPSRTNIFEKALLKAIIPFVAAPQDQKSPFLLLGRISAVSFSHKPGKEKKPKCTICGAVYQNYLLFVLHVELIHSDQFEVDKYEFSQDLLVIYYREPGKKDQNQRKYLQVKARNLFLLQSFEVRTKQILDKISSKFVKKYVKQKQQYYHSYDIFKEIRPESEGEDSEDDVAYIQRELQKLRMGEFTDINQQDKLFFITWNKAIHQAKSIHVILGREEILEVLNNFPRIAKEQGLKRLNLVMHAWTLWSSGVINSQDVSKFLQTYDDIQR